METYEAKFIIYDDIIPPTPYKELCGHIHSDWNIYMACRYVISEFAVDSAIPGGLLHDMSKEANDNWDMSYLLKECNSPSTKGGRLKVLPRIFHALDALRNGKEKDNVDV